MASPSESGKFRRQVTRFVSSEERLRTILEHAPVMIDSFDAEGRCKLWNRECEKALGYTYAEIAAVADPLALFYPDAAKRDRVAKRIAAADGVFRDFSVRAKDGSYRAQRWADFRLPTGETISVGYDITDQERTISALEASEARYRALLEAVPDIILRVTSEGVCLDLAPGADFAGESGDRFVGRALAELGPPEVIDPGLEALRKSIATGELQTLEVSMPEAYGGRRYEARMAASGDNEAVVMVRDVTEQRGIEAQLRQAQKLEAIGRLTGGIAHDFNNLLTVILGNLELLGDEIETALPHLRHHADEIHAAATRGARLIRKLLAFSRKTRLRLRPLALEQVVAETATTLDRLLPESIEIVCETEDGLEPVLADPDALQQIVMNLATNARDSMPQGGRLRLSVRRVGDPSALAAGHEPLAADDYLELMVADNGCGMNEETRRKVFDPFFTTKPPERGSGLGLPIVYGLVEQHRGRIDLESSPGGGTTVRVLIPVATGGVPETVPDDESAAPVGGGETVLLVEDEAGIREMAQRVLGRWGYRVLTAADGRRALELLRAEGDRVDLVVSDLVMPRMGGEELREAARLLAPTAAFLFMTGYAERELRPEAGSVEEVPVLEKPWTPNQLARSVRAVLDGAGLD